MKKYKILIKNFPRFVADFIYLRTRNLVISLSSTQNDLDYDEYSLQAMSVNTRNSCFADEFLQATDGVNVWQFWNYFSLKVDGCYYQDELLKQQMRMSCVKLLDQWQLTEIGTEIEFCTVIGKYFGKNI